MGHTLESEPLRHGLLKCAAVVDETTGDDSLPTELSRWKGSEDGAVVWVCQRRLQGSHILSPKIGSASTTAGRRSGKQPEVFYSKWMGGYVVRVTRANALNRPSAKGLPRLVLAREPRILADGGTSQTSLTPMSEMEVAGGATGGDSARLAFHLTFCANATLCGK